MKLLNVIASAAVLAFSVVTTSAHATEYDFVPSDSFLEVVNAGEVVVTFLSKTAAYSNDLLLAGDNSVILNNQTALAGQEFSLGNFDAGQALSFEIFVNNTGKTYSMGASSLNPDNFLHAAFELEANQPLVIGFEDLYNGGDKDYDDLVFSVTNVVAVPEPQTFAMLLAGIGLLGGIARRQA